MTGVPLYWPNNVFKANFRPKSQLVSSKANCDPKVPGLCVGRDTTVAAAENASAYVHLEIKQASVKGVANAYFVTALRFISQPFTA